MMRGWIFAVVFASCSPSLLLAQSAASVQARRPSPPSRYAEAQQRARYADPQVKPAAAAATRTARPRAPREAAQNPTRRTNSGGLLSKLGLPNLIPKALRDDEAEPLDDAPLPYDEAELGPPADDARAEEPRESMIQRQPPRPARQQTPAARQAMSGRQPAPPAAASRAVAPPSTHATSRVPRSSPVVNHRRNELAEALSGLTGRDREEPVIEEPAPDEGPAPYAAEVAPPADDVEALPSYLRGSRTAGRSAAVAGRRSAAAPLDIRDALLSDPSQDSALPPQAEVDEPATGAIDNLGPIAEQVEAAPSADLSPAETVAESPAPADDSNSATASEAAEAFGQVDAQLPNPAFAVEPPAPEAPAAQQPAPADAPAAAPAAAPAGNVLLTSGQPVIVSNIEGPQRIVVGRQAEYRVRVENRGESPASQLTATIAAPAGAEVVDAAATNGVVERAAADPAAANTITWRLYELAPGASQMLTIQLIPRSGRELQLGVQWVHAPVVANATVEIQEPKLSMEITGPADVLFGKSQRYALTISNPGNGTAEEVAIELTPPGGAKDSVVRHKVGALSPGQSRKIELELTAREAGQLKILAAATATGNVRTETVKMVQCRKPELQIDWRGPEKKYAGAVATYYFRVRNPGTASAEQVGVQLNLPPGAELVKASDGHAWDADRRTVLWTAAALQPGEERFMELQCRMTQPGMNKLDLAAQTAGGDLSDAKSVAVMVEALADLKLEVSDPKGVLPVGETAVYEIRISNRGLTSARGVNVVAMFSDGIDPAQVEGGQHSIADGRISFRTIDTLAAGSETILRIHAKASKSGTHIFRAEVSCDELEAKLAAEETTRFFADDERWADASTAYADEAQGTQTR